MKTALIYPFKKAGFHGCNPPLSLLYLGASLKQADEDVLIIDRDEDDLSDSDIMKRLIEYSPDLIGIPLYTPTIARAYELVNLLTSKANWEIVLGGPHATARPQEVLEDFKGANYLLRGESEESIVNLVKGIERGDSLETVQGLSYRKNGVIINNPDIPSNPNIDSIPFPARELLYSAYRKKTYWRIGHKGITDIMITSRGCPFDCNFCFKVSRKVRTRSPENVLEELILIRSQGIQNVHIMDDLFIAPKSRCLKILKMINELKLNMEFKVRARVDLIDEEILEAMKKARVKAVVYGFESGSQKMLDLMNKRTTVEMNYRAVALTKKSGLQCYADMFIGYPGETIETIRETERFLTKAKPTAVNFAVMYPLPNTKVYDEAKEKGILRDDWSVDGKIAWIKLPWIEDRADLWRYQRELVRRYLLHPVVIFNAIRFTIFNINFKQFKILVRYLAYYLRK